MYAAFMLPENNIELSDSPFRQAIIESYSPLFSLESDELSNTPYESTFTSQYTYISILYIFLYEPAHSSLSYHQTAAGAACPTP